MLLQADFPKAFIPKSCNLPRLQTGMAMGWSHSQPPTTCKITGFQITSHRLGQTESPLRKLHTRSSHAKPPGCWLCGSKASISLSKKHTDKKEENQLEKKIKA